MHSFRPVANLVLAFLCISTFAVSGLHAGAQAPVAPAAPASTAAAPPAVTTILHANANLVLVDVVVSEHGNAVHGLPQGNFRIFDNGREQTISSFEEHRPVEVPAIAKPIKLPPNTYTNLPVYPEATAINVLLLDGLNTIAVDQVYVRRKMIEYMDKIKPGTSLAIFTLSQRLRMIEGFTTDVAKLSKDFQAAKTGPSDSLDVNSGITDSMNNLSNYAPTPSGRGMDPNALSSAINQMNEFAADVTAAQEETRERMTLNALQQLARYLNAIPGRKNLIWFSGSFPIALSPDGAMNSPFRNMQNNEDDVRETSEMLSAARVAVYPVDGEGLLTPKSLDAANRGNGKQAQAPTGLNNPNTVLPNGMSNDSKDMSETLAKQASIKLIADLTGGKAYIDTNGLKEAVGNAVDNGASYYTISYVPAAEKLDGQFHKIQVRLNKSSYKLAYRSGFYANSPNKPSAYKLASASQMTTATLLGAPPETQILFLARVLPATDPQFKDLKMSDDPAGTPSKDVKGPLHRYIIDLTIDSHTLTFEKTPEGAHKVSVEFALVAYDSNFNQVNFLDRGIQLNLNDQRYARAIATGTPVRLALDLPAGEDILRIAIQDTAANRAGSIEIPVAVSR
jgi:VWFA-related protein